MHRNGFDPVTRFHLEETMELELGSNSKFKLTPGCEWLLEKAGSRREGGGRRRRRRRRRRCGSEPALEKVVMDEDEVEKQGRKVEHMIRRGLAKHHLGYNQIEIL